MFKDSQSIIHENGIQFSLLGFEQDFHIFFADFHKNSYAGILALI